MDLEAFLDSEKADAMRSRLSAPSSHAFAGRFSILPSLLSTFPGLDADGGGLDRRLSPSLASWPLYETWASSNRRETEEERKRERRGPT